MQSLLQRSWLSQSPLCRRFCSAKRERHGPDCWARVRSVFLQNYTTATNGGEAHSPCPTARESAPAAWTARELGVLLGHKLHIAIRIVVVDYPLLAAAVEDVVLDVGEDAAQLARREVQDSLVSVPLTLISEVPFSACATYLLSKLPFIVSDAPLYR